MKVRLGRLISFKMWFVFALQMQTFFFLLAGMLVCLKFHLLVIIWLPLISMGFICGKNPFFQSKPSHTCGFVNWLVEFSGMPCHIKAMPFLKHIFIQGKIRLKSTQSFLNPHILDQGHNVHELFRSHCGVNSEEGLSEIYTWIVRK